MKIVTILGARPQFIKAGTLSRTIASHPTIQEVIVHTGQHYDATMSDIFFEQMHIPKPNYFLGIGGKSHGAMTGQMIEKIEEVLLREEPDWVLVYGDTDSTLAGALAASKLHVKIAHVEAGLRSFNMKMPEEINRIVTDRVSTLLFCPTDTAVQNLKNEGFETFTCKIVQSGDVMYEGALFYRQYAQKPILHVKNDFVLCTIHRAENTEDNTRLKSIFEALNEIAKQRQIVLPIHPRTRNVLKAQKYQLSPNITLIEPVGYLEMIWLIDHCSLVMTDSGGLQKEAYFFHKPCMTLRDETEWVELVACGANVLVGANKETIISTFSNFTFKPKVANLYGENNASTLIIQALVSYA
ncbi:non-hydrolyzing UDP-N-acetylglucosamine 2-epimerase [Sulfurospirillum cavolei]|uniref:non-hydrolyzing UDP-N-acetylglucosamine 2-epimerase n=1 Tax=Sulfurospirillum cavolei TaxID=366522 RepID=UPI003FA1D69D